MNNPLRKLFGKSEPDRNQFCPETGNVIRWSDKAKRSMARHAAQPQPSKEEAQAALVQLEGRRQERAARKQQQMAEHQAYSDKVMARINESQAAIAKAANWKAYVRDELARGERMLHEMNQRHGTTTPAPTVAPLGSSMSASELADTYKAAAVTTLAGEPTTVTGKAISAFLVRHGKNKRAALKGAVRVMRQRHLAGKLSAQESAEAAALLAPLAAAEGYAFTERQA